MTSNSYSPIDPVLTIKQVTATIAYDPPAGAIGKLVAKLFQKEPAIQARRDLRRLRMFLETGEIATASPPNPAPVA